jgi:hypothetical protein
MRSTQGPFSSLNCPTQTADFLLTCRVAVAVGVGADATQPQLRRPWFTCNVQSCARQQRHATYEFVWPNVWKNSGHNRPLASRSGVVRTVYMLCCPHSTHAMSYLCPSVCQPRYRMLPHLQLALVVIVSVLLASTAYCHVHDKNIPMDSVCGVVQAAIQCM